MLRKPYAFVNRFSPYIFKFLNLLFVTHTTLAYLIDKQNIYIYIYKDASSLIETHNKRSVSTTFSYFIPTLEHFSLTVRNNLLSSKFKSLSKHADVSISSLLNFEASSLLDRHERKESRLFFHASKVRN